MKFSWIKRFSLLLPCLFLFPGFVALSTPSDPLRPYKPADPDLFRTILLQDSLLFDAFNGRNMDAFQHFFSEELEVYQDNTGVRNYGQSMEAFRSLFNLPYVLNRQRIKASIEVYPIRDYGAIETGLHTFCHTENGKQDCGTCKFVHIWKQQNGKWFITRIITYGH
jgi:hypothetical protein